MLALAFAALMHCGQARASSSRWLDIQGLPGVSARVAIATDPSRKRTLAQLLQADAFQAVPDDSRDTVTEPYAWFRIDLTVPEQQLGGSAWLRVVPALIYEADVHAADGSVQYSGLALALAQHSHPAFPPRFRVTLDQPTTRVYLRVGSAVPQLLQLTLLSEPALRQELEHNALRQGLFMGAALLMLLLALMNWAFTGQTVYRDFAAYITSGTLFMQFVNGYMASYLLTDAPHVLPRLPLVAGALMAAATIQFSLQVLAIGPRMARALRGVMGAVLLCSLASIDLALIASMAKVIWVTHLIVGLLLLGISLQQALRLRTAQGWVAFAAYLSFSAFEKAPLLSMAGWLPMTVWTGDLAKIGLAFQMLLTHLQLVIRMREQRNLESQALAARLEAQAERAQRKDLVQFLGMFGHEVRTPLTIIDAAAQSLEILPGADLPQNQQRHKRIRSAVERLSVLAREALSRERVEAGGWNPRLQSVGLAAVLDDTLALHGVALPGLPCHQARLPLCIAGLKGGTLEFTCPAEVPALQADPDMLKMALGNLLDNARKYADAGSTVRLRVECSPAAGPQAGSIGFHVLSQGCALSPGELAQVFDKYWRRDEQRGVAGAGLGLHLVRHIARAHGGSIEARSLPERWTCFSLQIPLQPALAHTLHTRMKADP